MNILMLVAYGAPTTLIELPGLALFLSFNLAGIVMMLPNTSFSQK
ncbi:hypothetical protein [Limosilactobacillus caccae]|nr:hypothetical protein [Limosilactobacillus caccae]